MKQLRASGLQQYLSRSIGPACVLVMVVCSMPGSSVCAADGIERSGDIVAIVLPAAAFIVSLTEANREGTWQFVKTAIVSQATVHAIKRIVDRRRPDGGRYSFPSGHTSGAFLGPGFLHLRHGLKYAWPAYIAAAWVGYTRVQSDRHFETDVFGGAAISMLTCALVVSHYESPVEVAPVLSSRYLGLRLGIRL